MLRYKCSPPHCFLQAAYQAQHQHSVFCNIQGKLSTKTSPFSQAQASPQAYLVPRTMHLLKKLPLFLFPIFHELCSASAAPLSALGSNNTSLAVPDKAAAPELSTCDFHYVVDMEIVDDELWPVPDEISYPQHIGDWSWFLGRR